MRIAEPETGRLYNTVTGVRMVSTIVDGSRLPSAQTDASQYDVLLTGMPSSQSLSTLQISGPCEREGRWA